MNFLNKNRKHPNTNNYLVSTSQLRFRFIFVTLLSVFLLATGSQNIYSQNTKKNKVRLKANYVKIGGDKAYVDIKATSKIKKKNRNVSNIELAVYNELEDEKIKLGTVTTNMKGESQFAIKDFNSLKSDSLNLFTLVVSFKGNDSYKKATKSIQFKDAEIKASLITKDSINYIQAILIDKSTDSVIVGESLVVQVQRLFKPLIVGEEFNTTDDNGMVIVPIERGIPGIDGNLEIEVVLDDSDDFGTVKAIVNAPIGSKIVENTTFDQRTMWGPRSKTPIFILVFTNLLIFGIWGIIIYLIINLFRIVKLKT